MRPALSFRVSDYDESGHSHNNFNFFDIQIIAYKIYNITLYKFIIAEMGCMIKKKQNKVRWLIWSPFTLFFYKKSCIFTDFWYSILRVKSPN